MRHIFTICMLWAGIGLAAQTNNGTPPPEASNMDTILGEWTAVNKTIRRDGSGKYDVDDQLYFKVYKVLGDFGHQVDWFSTSGEYYGSTVRAYSKLRKNWSSKWFDPIQGIWMDEVVFEFKEEKLLLEGTVEDETGKYEIRREHAFSEDGKIYTYHHYRKYPGMNDWMLIDTFEATRVR